jgi:outer membrane protein TolC
MIRFKTGRSLGTAFVLLAIYCACSGCHLLTIDRSNRINKEIGSSKHLSSRDPSKVVDVQPASGEVPDRAETEATSSPPEQPDRELKISLTDAISTALSNNMHLRVINSLSEEIAQRSEIEKAQFDTSFNTNAQYLQGTQQVSSALQAVQGGLSQYGTTTIGAAPGSPNILSAEQRFSTGTVARVGLGSNYNNNSPMGQYLLYNPAYQTAGSLIVEQALFRGRSREANMAGLRIAQVGQKQSAAEFQTDVNQTLTDVQRAYWMAWLAESQLATAKEFVDQAQATHALEQKKFELGEGGIVQTAAAAENLHSRKAECAQARQRSRIARNRLFALLGISSQDKRELKITDEPLADLATIDLEQGLMIAKQQRPEIEVRTLQVRQAQLELDRRRNNEQPDVRAFAGYSLTGLNNSLLGSLNQFDSAHFGSMSMGLRYNYVFGQRAEKAAANQAQLALMRQIRAREETEFLVQQQVRDALDAVNSAWEVLECQHERVAASRTQAMTFRQLHAAGQIDLDRLLRADQQLSSALQQSHNALIDYNIALTDWRFATGAMTAKLPTEQLPPAPEPTDHPGRERTPFERPQDRRSPGTPWPDEESPSHENHSSSAKVIQIDSQTPMNDSPNGRKGVRRASR